MQINLHNLEVHNNEAAQRYETHVEGYVALIQYRLLPDAIVFTHTEVPPALEGQGIAGKLVQSVLDDARERALQVIPLCPFVASYIRRHPQYQALVHPAYMDRVAAT